MLLKAIQIRPMIVFTVIVSVMTVFVKLPAVVAALPGDIAKPFGRVDLADLAAMTSWWGVAICDDLMNCHGADLSGPRGEPDGVVNLYDFAVLAQHWLEATDV